MPAHPAVVSALYRAYTLPELITKRDELLEALTAPDSVASDSLDGLSNSFNHDDLETLTQKLEAINAAIEKHETAGDPLTPKKIRGRFMNFNRATV